MLGEIAVYPDEENGGLFVDLIAHCIKDHEEEPDRMIVLFAASKSRIMNASALEIERVGQHLTKVVETSLKGLKFEGGNEERSELQ